MKNLTSIQKQHCRNVNKINTITFWINNNKQCGFEELNWLKIVKQAKHNDNSGNYLRSTYLRFIYVFIYFPEKIPPWPSTGLDAILYPALIYYVKSCHVSLTALPLTSSWSLLTLSPSDFTLKLISNYPILLYPAE